MVRNYGFNVETEVKKPKRITNAKTLFTVEGFKMEQFYMIVGVICIVASFFVGYYAGWKRQKLLEIKIKREKRNDSSVTRK